MPLGQSPDSAQPVAVAGGFLEALTVGGLVHLPLELTLDRPRVTGEEVDDAVDDLGVGLLRDVADARRVAALDVVVEAGNPRVAAWLRPLARAVLEDPVEHVERLAHLLRVRVWAEVGDASAVPLAREHDSREIVLERDRDVWKRLVVTQPDVERRPVPLDEVLLEMQRLDLAARDDHLDVRDPLGQLRDGVPDVCGSLEIAANARAQRLGLAHVEDLAARVAEDVDAGLRRQSFELLVESFLHQAQG